MLLPIPKLNAMVYKTKSTLGLGLEKIFQDGIDYYNSIEEKSFDTRVLIVKKYIMKDLIPRFQKLVANEINVKISSITVPTSLEDSLCFAMVPLALSNNINEANDFANSIMDRLSGFRNDREIIDTDPDTYDKLKQVADALDRTTHFVNLKDDLLGIQCHLILPIGAFMLTELFGKKIANLTAAELAAVYLHEIGHLVTMVQYAADIIVRSTILDEKILQFNKNADKTEKIKALKMLKETTKNKATVDVIERVEKAQIENVSVGTKILSIINSLTGFILFLIPFYFGILFRVLDDLFNFGKAVGSGEKVSDEVNTRLIKAFNERYPDEFVSQNGYSSYTISGLDKIISAMGNFSLLGNPINNSVSRFIVKLEIVLFSIIGMVIVKHPSDIYEDDFTRFERLIQNSYKSFKNQGMGPTELNILIKETERAIEAKNKYVKENKVQKLWIDFFNYVTNFLTPAGIIRNVLDRNFEVKYEDLQNKLNELNSSKLWYQSAKLKSLLKRK